MRKKYGGIHIFSRFKNTVFRSRSKCTDIMIVVEMFIWRVIAILYNDKQRFLWCICSFLHWTHNSNVLTPEHLSLHYNIWLCDHCVQENIKEFGKGMSANEWSYAIHNRKSQLVIQALRSLYSINISASIGVMLWTQSIRINNFAVIQTVHTVIWNIIRFVYCLSNIH